MPRRTPRLLSFQDIEAHAEGALEGEEVLEELVEGSVDVTGGADDHGFVPEPTMPRSR